jgi:hypothetical protein
MTRALRNLRRVAGVDREVVRVGGRLVGTRTRVLRKTGRRATALSAAKRRAPVWADDEDHPWSLWFERAKTRQDPNIRATPRHGYGYTVHADESATPHCTQRHERATTASVGPSPRPSRHATQHYSPHHSGSDHVHITRRLLGPRADPALATSRMHRSRCPHDVVHRGQLIPRLVLRADHALFAPLASSTGVSCRSFL